MRSTSSLAIGATRLGSPPVTRATNSTWLLRGRQYLTAANEAERLNASWDQAMGDEDVELLAKLLEQVEVILAGGTYNVEAVFP